MDAKIWDDRYADYEKYVEAFREVVVEVLNTQPTSAYEDRPIRGTHLLERKFCGMGAVSASEDELYIDYNYMVTSFLPEILREAYTRDG